MIKEKKLDGVFEKRKDGSFIRLRSSEKLTKTGKFKKLGKPCPVIGSKLTAMHKAISKQRETNNYSDIKREFKLKMIKQ